ncbi:acetyltransferase [Limnochorda pilosa]|uniref:Acetyltransferase n=1 Tax=Limnochorda pilosa TaxID=1555112 RepID=A0A0K2SGT8_LIMPI|nr:acetyltransferase [Limnochorda pilosa]
MTPPSTKVDRAWLEQLWTAEWGGTTMISRGKRHRLDDLEARIAWQGGERVGAVTYRIGSEAGGAPECEVLSLNARLEGKGIGSLLLEAVEAVAREAGCRRVWLTTTNDNLDALRFYQRRGYRLAALYPGAVDAARDAKPTIPRVGDHGIPIHDEIELEKGL